MTSTIAAPTIPTTDAETIAFALDHLDAFEVSAFLTDWRVGKDLKPWVEGRTIDLMEGQRNWTGHDNHDG